MQKSYKLDLAGIDTEAYQKNPVVLMLFGNKRKPVGQAKIETGKKIATVTFTDKQVAKLVKGNNYTLGTTTATYAGGVVKLMGLSMIPVLHTKAAVRKRAKGAQRRKPGRPRKPRAANPRSASGQWYADVGRPVKLDRKLLDATLEYYNNKKTTRELPLVEELAIDILDVDRHTVARWHDRGEDKEWLAKQVPERQAVFKQFCATIKKLATMQLMHLKVRGIDTGHNTVAIFLMKADHNMIETSRTELGGIGGRPIEFKPVEVLSTKGRKK